MESVLSLGRMARTLGVTRVWLKAQAESGAVPVLKAGKRFLFNREVTIEAVASLAARGGKGGGK